MQEVREGGRRGRMAMRGRGRRDEKWGCTSRELGGIHDLRDAVHWNEMVQPKGTKEAERKTTQQ